jgi:hypothetical protein
VARSICLSLPIAPAPTVITVPGMGNIQAVRRLTLEAYDVCGDARSLLTTLQPVFGALGMPLCILGCLTSVIAVFSSDFPYINPAKLAKIPENCGCLTSFTPFGFCGLIRSLVNGISTALICMVSLLADVVAMEAQAASMLLHPETASAGRCLQGQANVLRQNALTSFNPVIKLFNASTFLFTFVGIPVDQIDEASGENAAETLAVISSIQLTISVVAAAINSACP